MARQAAWTPSLDLQLVAMLESYWGAPEWRNTANRLIHWDMIFARGDWPPEFTKEALKERWQESFRRWLRKPGEKRAPVVSWQDLRTSIATDGRMRQGATRPR